MKTQKHVIRVLCVDDHPLVLEGIARKIDRQSDMKVIGTADNGEEAVTLFLKSRPDVVRMDLQLRGMSGLKAIEAIRHHDPSARVLRRIGIPEEAARTRSKIAGQTTCR